MRPPYYVLAALGLIGIGTHAVRNPQQASKQFGLATSESFGLGFVRGCGSRDIAIGLLLLMARRPQRLPFLIISLLGIADATTVVVAHGKPTVRHLGPHLLGCLGIFTLAILAAKTHD